MKTWTPNIEKFVLIERNVHGSLFVDKQIYEEKIRNKINTMGILLKRVTPPQEEPQTGHLGGVPEERVVITRENGSLYIIAPQDLPVGQDAEGSSGIDNPDPM